MLKNLSYREYISHGLKFHVKIWPYKGKLLFVWYLWSGCGTIVLKSLALLLYHAVTYQEVWACKTHTAGAMDCSRRNLVDIPVLDKIGPRCWIWVTTIKIHMTPFYNLSIETSLSLGSNKILEILAIADGLNIPAEVTPIAVL